MMNEFTIQKKIISKGENNLLDKGIKKLDQLRFSSGRFLRNRREKPVQAGWLINKAMSFS
jgi:hypothetical protein